MNIKQKIEEALTCDKGCGHTLEPDICFKHQCERVEQIIKEEANKTIKYGADFDDMSDKELENYLEKQGYPSLSKMLIRTNRNINKLCKKK